MVFKELIFFNEKNTMNSIATFVLLKLATEAVFSCIKYCLYLFALIGICNLFIGSFDKILFVVGSILAWTIARMIRIAIFEIRRMKDEKMILSIFSGSVSFVSLVVAVITLVITI